MGLFIAALRMTDRLTTFNLYDGSGRKEKLVTHPVICLANHVGDQSGRCSAGNVNNPTALYQNYIRPLRYSLLLTQTKSSSIFSPQYSRPS